MNNGTLLMKSPMGHENLAILGWGIGKVGTNFNTGLDNLVTYLNRYITNALLNYSFSLISIGKQVYFLNHATFEFCR